MLNFRYRSSIVLVPGLFLAASWVVQADVSVARGAKNDESCSGHKNRDGDLQPTPSMVQRDVLEFAMSVDEERREAPEVAPEVGTPDALLSRMEAPEVAAALLSTGGAPEVVAPDAPLSKVSVIPAPKVVAQPQQKPSGKSNAASLSEAVMEALDGRYNAKEVADAQQLQSMRCRVAAEFSEFLRRLGVWKLVALSTTRTSGTWVLFVPLLMISITVVLIWALWKDTVANKECDRWWDLKSRPARGSFREGLPMPKPLHSTQVSQPPSIIALLASPGKPSELMPGKTPEMSATSLVQQTNWLSGWHSATPTCGWVDSTRPDWLPERRSATPVFGRADNPNLSIDQLARGGISAQISSCQKTQSAACSYLRSWSPDSTRVVFCRSMTCMARQFFMLLIV